MDKLKISIALMIVFCMLMGFASKSAVGEEDQEEKKPVKATLTERLTSLLYVSSPSSSPSTFTNWDRFKSLLHQPHAYFFPPNLESNEANQDMMSGSTSSRGGAGEKVKEAVTRSMEKGKENVEDSAKSAAKLAGETMHKTSEKVKKSLSKGEKAHHHQQSHEL
ncbi:hypothetical protein L484_012154 [Morus notabilis]|uniref:Uncharacterized protein n=1 Tax=Morus notabilis TaxID=981085 RepID=W9RFI3_9ROSA|nr:hypothetical protein L484_012154 [Morus notabilis]